MVELWIQGRILDLPASGINRSVYSDSSTGSIHRILATG